MTTTQNAETETLIWACTDCTLSANGYDVNPGLHVWSRVPHSATPASGMMRAEHDCDDDDAQCDCETIDFSSRACEACECTLAGERHAFTLFWS